MVKFLIHRPIAVLMAFTACFIVGLVAYFSLPVSLLPDIDIPQITIQVSSENASARELENTMVAPVRRQLMQVSGLSELRSETRDGSGIIRLSFEFGTNTDLAFIEVNEKIDAAMNSLPKDAVRPKAVKASATDIPVFYLNLTLKQDVPYAETDDRAFMDMCELAENVVKRRIEQLPQVAMADMTGVPQRMLRIVPDVDRLEAIGMGGWKQSAWGLLTWRISFPPTMWSREVCWCAMAITSTTSVSRRCCVRPRMWRISTSTPTDVSYSSRMYAACRA